MTWIDNLEERINKEYKIFPSIKTTLKARYGKHNRATFAFDNLNSVDLDQWLFHRKDVHKSQQLRKYVKKEYSNDAKIRNEWTDDFVYFNDLDRFLRSLPYEILMDLKHLEVMDPALIQSKQAGINDYQGEISFCKKLPFDKYRYQVYIVTSINERESIGIDNLLHLRLSIEAYDGIKSNDTFRKSHKHRWWVPETYFYADSLDWLPLIRLMEPRYVKKIKQFKTLEEVQNENST